MAGKRCLLLKAIKHNWGMIGPGSWLEVKWLIFRDGSYEILSVYRPNIVVLTIELMLGKNERSKRVLKRSAGRMNEASFSKLREALMCDPWRDPSLEVVAFDGVAWKIESYRDDGAVEKSSGKLGYIYGHRILETIVSLLPSGGKKYGSSACISVHLKDQ